MSKSDYRKLRYSQRRPKTLQLADQFGVDKDDYNYLSSGREQFNKKGDFGDLEDAVARAIANDYDVRRSTEAARMSGAKRADGLPIGISNISEAYDVHKFLKRTHRKKLDGGKNFGSANDYAGVTKHFVEKDREEMLDTLATKDDLTAMKQKLMKKATKGKHSGESHPAVPSERLAAAQERLHDSANDPSSLYEKNNETAPRTDEQTDAARTFLDDYKLDVAKGAALRQDIKTNVGNASNTVTNVYGR